jgi:hypothetical protein
MAEMARDNPFEKMSPLRYNPRTAAQNHGREAMVHLAVGVTDTEGEEALDMLLDHNEEFEVWLEQKGREAFLVPEESVGCHSGGRYVVISKPRTEFAVQE